MLVNLKQLKPNPLRDFGVDPIDPERVALLAKSIKDDGFWGGVVCRQTPNGIEIAAGQHRVEAAMAAGIQRAEVFVGDFDDEKMLHIYAVENATQRGNEGTAQIGSVAAAVQFLAWQMVSGSSTQETLSAGRSAKANAASHFATGKGIGQPAVAAQLVGVPGITEYVIQNQLANLKSSGHYDRIVTGVKERFERENAEELKKLAKAEADRKAADERAAKAEAAHKEAVEAAEAARDEAEKKRAKAAEQRAAADAEIAKKKRAEAAAKEKEFEVLRKDRDAIKVATAHPKEKEFDLDGVRKFLTAEDHIDTFRKAVAAQGVKPYVPLTRQASLARELVDLAKENGEDMSRAFISRNIVPLARYDVNQKRKAERETQAETERRVVEVRWRRLQEDFIRGCNLVISKGVEMHELTLKYKHLSPTLDLINAMKNLKRVVAGIEKHRL